MTSVSDTVIRQMVEAIVDVSARVMLQAAERDLLTLHVRDWQSYPTSSIRRSRPRTFAAAARVSSRMWSLSGSRIRSNWLRLVRIA